MQSNQQHPKTFLLLTVLLLACCCQHAFSQSWSITGNANIASATQYLGTKDPNDLVFRTNAIERGRVLGAGGAWRFGTATNFAKIDSLGRLTFKGTGGYQVAANKYVFQYATTPNYGLFFNTAPLQYEFRNSAATPVFTVNATTGAGSFAGSLKVGAYTLPATDGTSGQVLKTNGSGAVSWSTPAAGGWSLTGNAGTSAAINFIGTTDNKPFIFKTNNLERMRIGAGGNVGIGTTVPKGALNVVGAYFATLTTPGFLQLGDSTGYNMGMDNEVIQARYNGGASTLYLNYSGGATWIGSHNGSAVPAIYAAQDGRVSIGNTNVLTGYALSVNATSSIGGINIADPGDNTAISFTKSGLYDGAVFSKTNTSSGIETITSYNAGSGAGIVASSASGYGVWGKSTYSAGVYGEASTSGGNISIGVIGYGNYGVYATTANNSTYYAGYFVGDVLSTTGVYATSDQKLKENIKDVTSAMDIINRLHPKFYNFRNDGDYKLMNLPKGIHYGLIAQEVEKVLPNLVKDSKFETGLAEAKLPRKPGEGEPKASPKSETIDFKSLNYTELIPILIKGMQEQQKEIEDLKAMVKSLTQDAVNSSAEGSSAITNKVILSGAVLEQNTPNPLNNSTSIRYNVPAGNASLLISNLNGKSIKQLTLQTGAGTVNIDASTLSAGAYSYSLIVDGKTIATRKMIVAR